MVTGGATECSASLAGALCTVTLVGKRTVLTAAHCVRPGENSIVCFESEATTYKPDTLAAHPDWDPASQLLVNDIAVGILDVPPGRTPAVLARVPPAVGQSITLVGYGTTGEDLRDAGEKRIATNTIKGLEATRFSYDGTGDGEGNTCKGDSGGPAFAVVEGRELQFGVTSAGVPPCGTLGYSTRVDSYISWIEQVSGGDLYDPGPPDTTRPVVTINSPADGASLNETPVRVTVTASDDRRVQEVELIVNGKNHETRDSAPYTFDVNLPEGNHTLRAVALDAAGNFGDAQISIIVHDLPAPNALPLRGSGCQVGRAAGTPAPLWTLLLALAALVATRRSRRGA